MKCPHTSVACMGQWNIIMIRLIIKCTGIKVILRNNNNENDG